MFKEGEHDKVITVNNGLYPLYSMDLSFKLKAEKLDNSWGTYRKKTVTRAKRIREPFAVETREGTLVCKDGWLAIDSEGFFYPIAASEFERIYESEDKGLFEKTEENGAEELQ